MIRERRIYCLTPDCKSMLMWSHYAGNHRGICLAFGVDNPLFSRARRVAYRSVYPRWMPHEFEIKQDLTITLILTKAMEWSYEHEYRLISLQSGSKQDYLMAEADFFRLPPNALKFVIVGCEGDYETVSKIVREYEPGLPVKRIIRSPGRYELSVEKESQ